MRSGRGAGLVRSEPMARALPIRAHAGMIACVLVLAVGALVGTSSLPAVAQEDDPASTPAVEAPVPAISVPDEEAGDPEPEWSYRFLVPATLVVGTLAVVGAIIMYFVRVTRNRYRVIR